MELFRERGYEATTAAEIAAKAGVTERTFFRHFPDKREVLFHGEEAFRAALTEAAVAAADDLDPMGVLLWAFRAVGRQIEENRSFSEPRQQVIARTPALQERVLTKIAGLTAALAEVLRRRGVEDRVATLASQVGMAAFSYAADAWAGDPTPGMDAYLTRAFDELHGLASAIRKPDPNVG